MKIKTTDLTGRALDWAVGVAVGESIDINPRYGVYLKSTHKPYSPTTNSGQWGPHAKHLIGVEGGMGDFFVRFYDPGSRSKGDGFGQGEQFEIAFCRSMVDFYLGDQVDVPEVLL